jgi:hypothetical protein
VRIGFGEVDLGEKHRARTCDHELGFDRAGSDDVVRTNRRAVQFRRGGSRRDIARARNHVRFERAGCSARIKPCEPTTMRLRVGAVLGENIARAPLRRSGSCALVVLPESSRTNSAIRSCEACPSASDRLITRSAPLSRVGGGLWWSVLDPRDARCPLLAAERSRPGVGVVAPSSAELRETALPVTGSSGSFLDGSKQSRVSLGS